MNIQDSVLLDNEDGFAYNERVNGEKDFSEGKHMMYPFLTLNDETEIVHSEMKEDGTVKVYMERPCEEHGFDHAACWLPAYRWEDIDGFNEREIAYFQSVIESTAHLIIEFSRESGFENAANF